MDIETWGDRLLKAIVIALLCILAMMLARLAFASSQIASGEFTSDTAYADEDEEAASWVELPDGNCTVFLRAVTSFSNGHIIMQGRRSDGVSAFNITGGDWAANQVIPCFLGAGVWVRLQMTGSNTPDVHWEIRPRVYRTENYQFEGTDTVDGLDQLPAAPTNTIESSPGTINGGGTSTIHSRPRNTVH